MEVPPNTEAFEHRVATVWFDDDGVLYSVAKAGHVNIAAMEDYFKFVKKLIGNKKIRMITDVTRASPLDSETRNHTAKLLPQIFLAMAIISDSNLGLLKGKTFMELSNQPYPIALFTSESEASAWLKSKAVG
jgi:hypothetical protein